MIEKGKPWWEDWYGLSCPKCESTKIKRCNSFKYTYRKDKNEIQKYECEECGLEFWE